MPAKAKRRTPAKAARRAPAKAPRRTSTDPTAKRTDPYQRLRAICVALPEVEERISHGEAAWFVHGKKSFATTSDHHHDDRRAFWCAAPDGAQEALVASDPERFFRPPYVGHRGWLGVYLDVAGTDWGLIADLVTDAYRVVAPKRLADQLGPRPGD
jgi:hypothetical protein